MKKFDSIKKSGQATVEFIFSFSFLLFFFLFFITIGVNLAVGYVVHYAVFKTSRFYLTYDNGANRYNVLTDAQNQAYEVAKPILDKLPKGVLSFNQPGVGVIYEFVGAKYLFTPILQKIGPFSLPEDFQNLSESFLGKEPSRDECYCRTLLSLGQECSAVDNDLELTVDDNGC